MFDTLFHYPRVLARHCEGPADKLGAESGQLRQRRWGSFNAVEVDE